MFSVGASVEGVGGGHGPLHLPRPLIPSPPFTLSRSPTPAQLESVHFQLLPLSSQQPQTTPSHSTPSPTFPPVFSGQSHSGNFPPVFSGQRNSLTFSPVSSAERNSSRHRQKYVHCLSSNASDQLWKWYNLKFRFGWSDCSLTPQVLQFRQPQLPHLLAPQLLPVVRGGQRMEMGRRFVDARLHSRHWS